MDPRIRAVQLIVLSICLSCIACGDASRVSTVDAAARDSSTEAHPEADATHLDAQADSPSLSGCVEAGPDSLVAFRGQGSASMAFGDMHFAVAYIGQDAIPTVERIDLSSREASPSRFVDVPVQSLRGFRTAVAYRAGLFGFGWYTERTRGANTWGTAVFATVREADGVTGEVWLGSPDLGGSGEFVAAQEPQVSVLPRGFFMSWNDTRTKTPRVTGVNLSGWAGLYGRFYDEAGQPEGSDQQVVQRRSPDPGVHAAVSDGDRIIAVWARSDRDSVELFALPSDRFGRDEAVEPTHDLPLVGFSPSLSAVTGPDGRAFVLLNWEDREQHRVGHQLLTMDAVAAGSFQVWPSSVSRAVVEATSTGYVVAALAPSGLVSVSALDEAGSMSSTGELDLSVTGDESIVRLAVRAVTSGTEVAALVDSGNGEDFRVLLARVCSE